ncbi:unnamed protein product [Linum trigynum]|uniref:F-box domain-containing protein n=1 Tax=Linum trigynum TaxID=586398 RepID=A0AAV2GDY6_9ROSI
MKRTCDSSTDRLTDLPVEVIQRILVFLPIKDAAKTSVLSRKWRHQWRSIPQLVFDDGFARISRVSESESKVRNKFTMLNLYRALLVHDGPITKFVLSIPGLTPCDEIDGVVLYLSNKGLQDLTLEFYGPGYNADGYQLHSSLFSAIHLKCLTLQSCEVTQPSWFIGFSKLTDLRLEQVTLPCDFFTNFLTMCPALESLRVTDCGGYAAELEIVAPFLKSFHLNGSLKDISFKCTPRLLSLTLDVYETDMHEMVAFFASITTLQQLCISTQFMRELAAANKNVPTRLPSPLHGLEVLEIIDVALDSLELKHVFLCLITSSPNLRRLRVEIDFGQLLYLAGTTEFSSIRKLLEAEDCPGFSSRFFQHLKVFRMEASCGTQVELDLVRFILATAPLLQRIHITPACHLSFETRLKFTVEAMRYKRVSKEAQLIYDMDFDQ